MRKLGLAAPLFLAACAATPAPGEGGTCRPDSLAAFAGRSATPETLAELQRESGAKTIRVVQPGMMVTMEFSAERVTVQLAPGNKIERASCG